MENFRFLEGQVVWIPAVTLVVRVAAGTLAFCATQEIFAKDLLHP